MEREGQEKQLYAGRRTCDGYEVEVCLCSAESRARGVSPPRPPDVRHQVG